MGINPTPTNHRSFTFDGKSTREFGVYITGKDVFNSPERAVEMISIPGRDGEYALDQGHFNNIEVTYRAGIVADSTTDFAEAISNFRNWLASREGYCRLTDEYNTEEYRMAVFKNAIALEHEGLLTGEFDVTFDCKPQRYLLEGEEIITIGEYKDVAGTDNEPYLFRQSPQFSAEYDTEIDTLVGGSVAWNQTAHELSNTYYGYTRATATYSDGEATVSFTGSSDGLMGAVNKTAYRYTIAGHKYFASATAKYSAVKYFKIGFDSGTPLKPLVANEYTEISNILNCPSDNSALVAYLNEATTGDEFKLKNVMLIDLTQMFGSTIADYIYSLEQANAGAGVAWFRKLFPKPYYAYNAGELMSVQASSHDMVGFNQWDEEWEVGGFDTNGSTNSVQDRIRSKNYIPCVPNQGYYFKQGSQVWNEWSYFLFYDADKTLIGERVTVRGTFTTPNNACYMKFNTNNSYGNTYNHDICINISDASKNGTYEPYVENTYPLDDSLTLRGIPKLDANGNLYYDGDTYESDGTVTRKYGTIDLSAQTWNYQSSWESWYTDYIADMRGTDTGAETPKFICDKYDTIATNYGLTPQDFGGITSTTRGGSGCRILVRNGSTTVAPTGHLVYELATPTTETADAFEQVQVCYPNGTEEYVDERTVQIPVGHNTKYGKNPIVLYNPTWFPSKPLLAVDGYGEIKFNNRSIVNIENATLGDIKQLVNESKALSMTTTFDNAMFNVGDTITVDLSYFNYGAYIIMNASTTPTTSGTVTDSDAHFTTVVTDCVADQGISPSPLYVHVKTTCTPITFTLGTPDTVTNTTEAVVDTQGDKCKWTQTVKYEIDGSGNHKISIKQTLVGASGTNVTTATNMNSNPMILCNSVVAHSTLSILGNPTYIDCDIGEAYMVKDGEPISLNQYIDLGSDLPTLPSGDTEVTYDNTINKVEVKPNWWKV